jgi:hypothetical protein
MGDVTADSSHRLVATYLLLLEPSSPTYLPKTRRIYKTEAYSAHFYSWLRSPWPLSREWINTFTLSFIFSHDLPLYDSKEVWKKPLNHSTLIKLVHSYMWVWIPNKSPQIPSTSPYISTHVRILSMLPKHQHSLLVMDVFSPLLGSSYVSHTGSATKTALQSTLLVSPSITKENPIVWCGPILEYILLLESYHF